MDLTYVQILVIVVVATALLFDFVNGWNDAANAIATVVGTRVLSPTKAVLLAAVFNMLGALSGVSVADTMAKMIDIDQLTTVNGLVLIIAGLLAAACWAAVMTLFGLPISGSHSLVGGIVGAAVAASGVGILVVSKVGLTLLAMLVAPVLGFAGAYMFYVALMWWTRRVPPSTMNRSFTPLQIVSSCWMAFTHGLNDAQKVMGIITMALIAAEFQKRSGEGQMIEVQLWVILSCGAMISIGTAVGGWKVIKTLGDKLTKLGPPEGFAAETSASLVLTIAAWLGIPTSTTHVITGSILGVGATRGVSSVQWGLGEKIILAWVFTLPSAAALGGAFYWLLAVVMPGM